MKEEALRASDSEKAGDKKDHANQKCVAVAAPVDSVPHDEKCVDAHVEYQEPPIRLFGSYEDERCISLKGDLENEESVRAVLRDVGLKASSWGGSFPLAVERVKHSLWNDIEMIELRSSKFREYTMILHGQRSFYDIRFTVVRILPCVFTHTPRGEQCPDGAIATTDYSVTREALVTKQHLNPVVKVSAFSIGSPHEPPHESKLPIADEREEENFHLSETVTATKIFHCDHPPGSNCSSGLYLYPETLYGEEEVDWHDDELMEDLENERE
jgi:hypothetical protein